jgi:hypothetical protein
VPHALAPQLTVHVTWGFALTSFSISARKVYLALTWSDAGAVKATEIGIGETMVMLTERESDGITTEAAVTVTVPPDGMAGGAM